MKLGCCSTSFRRCFESGELDLLQWMALCAKDLRVGGISIHEKHLAGFDEEYIQIIKRTAVDLHLAISTVRVETDFGLDSDEARNKEMEKVEMICGVAAALGAPVVTMSAGKPAYSRRGQWEEMIRCMQVACMMGERYGVVLAMENGGSGAFVENYGDVDRIVHEVNSEWLRFNLRTGAFENDLESVEKSMLYTVHTHAVVFGDDASTGTGGFDFAGYAKIVKDLNYRGFIAVEYAGGGDEKKAAPGCIDYLRGLLPR